MSTSHQKIALTGATGFVGGALLQRLLNDGFNVRALARRPDALREPDGLADNAARENSSLAIVKGGLNDDDAVASLVDGVDVVIHCAGLTHALSEAEFEQANVTGAAHIAQAAALSKARMVHISSMAARAPHLSPYARTKRDSEDVVAKAMSTHHNGGVEQPGGEWVNLRLPAIYGPGDLATLPYFRLVKAGLAPEPGSEPEGRASILFVDDIVAAVMSAITAPAGRVYEINDDRPEGHSWREIGEAMNTALGRRRPARRLRLPRPMLDAYATCVEGVARLRGKAEILTRGKVAEFFHADFVARDNLLSDATSWRAVTPLADGFAKTAQWYQKEGML